MTEVVTVLERFVSNPSQTSHEVRVKLGVLDALAAELYAITVFLCDGLLQLKLTAMEPSNRAAIPAHQFFVIAKRFPLELQMILCHRVAGSMKQNILHKDSEAAFQALAKSLLLHSRAE